MATNGINGMNGINGTNGTNGLNGTNGMSSAKVKKQSLLSLAEDIQREAKAITDFCNANDFTSPSLSQEWPDGDLPEHIQASRMKLREAANAVHDIAVGPFDHSFSLAWGVCIPSSTALTVC